MWHRYGQRTERGQRGAPTHRGRLFSSDIYRRTARSYSTASGSAAACNRTIAVLCVDRKRRTHHPSGATSAEVTTSGTGTLTLTVTDSQGSHRHRDNHRWRYERDQHRAVDRWQ